jgi:DNA polymerase I-like protein with 3'-5' exonuclease and polymerase domains
MVYLITEDKSKYSHLSKDILLGEIDDVLFYFKDKQEIEFDTETTGLDCHYDELIYAQFGDKDNQFVVDIESVDILEFKILLETKLLILQNAKFDLKFLYVQGIIPTKIYDTFLAESVLNMGRISVRKGLYQLVERYCGVTLNQHMKSSRDNANSIRNTEEFIQYSADDVKYLGLIKEKQLLKLEKENLLRSIDLDNKFVRVLAYVEYCGFYLDGKKWKAKMDKDLVNYELATQALNSYVFDNKINKYISMQMNLFSDAKVCLINWSSSKQVINLFKDLGINTKIKDKASGKMKDSVDASVLASQSKDFEIIPLFTNYQKCAKLISTYGENVFKQIHPNTGRLHTIYRQLQATGRMSCGETNKKKGIEHLNLQNVPANHEHRGCFVPEEGNTLVVADYSGQESVVFANFSKDPDLLKFYRSGLSDMHSFIAQKIYPELKGLTLKEIKSNHKEKRQNAKGAGFAIQYGGEGITIANNLNISEKEGNAIYDGYFKAFPGIKNYFERCKAAALALGYVKLNNVSYRKSYSDFYEAYKEDKDKIDEEGFWEDYKTHKTDDSSMFQNYYKPLVRSYFKTRSKLEKMSLNYPIQGTSAEITKYAAIMFFDEILKNRWFNTVKICNIVHDEIVVECPIDMGKEIGERLQYHMEQAGKPFCKVIPLKAEPWIGNFWNH